jgi:hypothetical protein
MNPQKRIVARETCQSLIAMVAMGKVQVIKEHTLEGPVYSVISKRGTPLGVIDDRYKFMFEKLLFERGSEDGLFEGCSQTTA